MSLQSRIYYNSYYRKMRYHVKKAASQSLLLSSQRLWSMDSCLKSSALSQVYLSLTFQLSQTAAVKVENVFFYFPDCSCMNCCYSWSGIRKSYMFASEPYMFALYTILDLYVADAFRCVIILYWCSSNENSHKK